MIYLWPPNHDNDYDEGGFEESRYYALNCISSKGVLPQVIVWMTNMAADTVAVYISLFFQWYNTFYVFFYFA